MKQTCLRQKVSAMTSRLAFPDVSLRYRFLYKVTYDLSKIEDEIQILLYDLRDINIKLKKSLPKIP